MASVLGLGLLAGCASPPTSGTRAQVTIERTTHGVAHVTAQDMESLAYGVAYAYAQDNVCMVADLLVTARGMRSATFGPRTIGLLGRRYLPNEQIDLFMAAHMDDAALERQWSKASAEAQTMLRGYVAGYNRYLADRKGQLPAACAGKDWVQPMTLPEYRRLAEITAVQAGIAALADGMVGARPPAPGTAQGALEAPAVDLADAADALREAGVLDSPLGSNAWAFGKDTTANGSGMLLGNPHFPWSGPNRFYQLHLRVPGQLDVMGAGLGIYPVVSIGFNRDVAWSHTVSTGKRFTLYELALVPGDPLSYLVDGQPEKMTARTVRVPVRGDDSRLQQREHTVYSTRWGPVVVVPRAGLTWNARTAYALRDANAGNTRTVDAALALARARNVEELHRAHAGLGLPWVNTLGADRSGRVLYTDTSVVPDVDAAQLERCAPSAPAAALRRAAGLVVLNGARADCAWRQDSASPVPGLIPQQRMPVAVRTDWVHNSNDSFFYTHPAQTFEGISPLVGDAALTRPRTRAGLAEIPEMLARGKVTLSGMQDQLYQNRNFMAQVVVPDLLAACANAPTAEARDACAALRGWDLRNNVESRGAHLFREFWRTARNIPGVHRIPFDPKQPVATPAGLKMDDAATATKVWESLTNAVKAVRAAGFALDAPLGSVQRPEITEEAIALHGGDEFEGVLNNIGRQEAAPINARGLRIDYGTSYVQTVTFDARGPVAQALLTYGQSTDPASPHANDQMRLFSRKQWPTLPFHAEDVARERIGQPLTLVRP
ncbi:penicillin acylase family protein [Acidovorax lacteus]|uniref:N-acyl homoserine lactone acylase QqaR n=1 Tax=Acidovorax lacteus TaxID=1924988 RepID=A0ABP8L1W9_9BURK